MNYVIVRFTVTDGMTTINMVYGPFDEQAAQAAYKVIRAECEPDASLVIRGLFSLKTLGLSLVEA